MSRVRDEGDVGVEPVQDLESVSATLIAELSTMFWRTHAILLGLTGERTSRLTHHTDIFGWKPEA